ncbi:retrovirus-related pol polyprotein from transposon TNT 1-94 [Tanacetum coccineum]
MNELVNDGIKLSKLEINTSFINGLPKKWLSFCQSLRNINHVKESELASIFGKLKYEENLTDSIYESEKKKSLVTTTPLSTAFFSTFIVKDFQASLDDEEDTRNEEDVSSDDNEMTEVKVILALADDENVVVGKESTRNGEWHVNTKILKENKNLRIELKELTAITETWLNSYDKVNQCISEQISSQKKRMLGVDQLTKDSSSYGKTDLVCVKSSVEDIKVSILGIERPWLSEAEGFILPNHDIADESSVCSTLLPPLEKLAGAEPVSRPKTIKSILKSNSTFKAEALKGVIINEPSAAFAKASTSKTNPDHAAQTSHLTPEIKNLNRTDHRTCDHAEYMSTINMSQHLKSRGGSSSRSKTPRPSKHFFPPCIHYGFNDHLFDDCVNYSICDICGSYDHDTYSHDMVISLRRGIKPRNPQQVTKSYETRGSTIHTITNHNDIKWLRRGEALQAKKAEAFQSKKTESSNANRSKTPTKSRCSRHMNGVKSYLHKYVEQPRPKVMSGDDSTCITEVSISQLCDAKYIVQFDEKRGTIFYSNKEIVMIAPRIRDVYVLDMTSSTQESYFFAKATKNFNWLWHKRLAHLNFKTINQLAKQNLVIGFTSLVYSKDKPCSSCEKGKHHRASFKIKQASSIKKYLHLLHMDLFRPVTPRSINHEKYTLVVVDDYSSTDAIKFTKPLDDNITIAESERYPPDEYLHLYESSQRYQVNSNVVSFIDPNERLEPVVIKIDVSSDQHDQAEQNDQNDQNDHSAQDDEILNDDQSEHSNHNNYNYIIDNLPNTKDIQTYKILSSLTEDASDSNRIPISTNPSLSILSMAYPAPQDRWSQDKHIELVNIIRDPGAGMLTRAMAKELSAASAHHPGWVDAMQEELNQFARNKVWTLVPAPYGIDYDETFAPVVRLEAIRIFLAFATYMNFTVYQIDVKSAFLNGKLKKEVYVKQPPGFESNEFPNHVFKLNEVLYGLKQAPRAWYETLSTFLTKQKFVRVKTPMVPPNNLGPDLNVKAVNETQYRANLKESHLIAVKRNFKYLKGTPSLDLWYPKCSGFDLKGYSDSDYAGCNMDRKSTLVAYHILKGDIELYFIPTQYQLADIFTNPVDEPTFRRLICELGMMNIDGSKLEPSNDSSDED